MESELCALDNKDKLEFLQSLGINDINQCGLQVLINKAYRILGLQTYYTSGPTETKAWTIRSGSTAPQVSLCSFMFADTLI